MAAQYLLEMIIKLLEIITNDGLRTKLGKGTISVSRPRVDSTYPEQFPK